MSARSVLITGCSRGGIGDGLAREFHSRGLTVFATARDPAKMAHLEDLGIRTVQLDVTSAGSVAEAARAVRRATRDRGLDILVNNAGTIVVMPFADCPLDDMRRVLDTNVLGAFAVTQALLPLLVRARGAVVNIGSVTEVVTPVYHLAYTASKAALRAFSTTLRLELRPLGVRVVHVMTGGVQSNMTGAADGDKMPAESLYEPVREMVEKRKMMMSLETFVTAEEFARQVADDLLGGSPPPVLWRGTMALMMRLLNVLLFLCPPRLAVGACYLYLGARDRGLAT